MEKLSRRGFLKLAGAGLGVLGVERFPVPNGIYESQEYKDGIIPDFKYIGPYIDCVRRGSSEGERAGWVDRGNADRIIVGTWLHGLWKTANGGKNWEKMDIPVASRGKYSPEPPVSRDMLTVPGTKEVLIVFDYSLAIGSPDNPNWDLINLPTESYVAQTACILPDGRVFVGGIDIDSEYAGVIYTDFKTIRNTIYYNRENPESPKKFEWKSLKGLSSEEKFFFIRTINHMPSADYWKPGKIFIGGWAGGSAMVNNGNTPGTGVICVDDRSLEIIEKYSFPFKQKSEKNLTEPMSVNMIKTTHYKGHEIIFVGGEGSGGGRGYNPERPHMQIIVDGVAYPQEIVNSKGLVESGGGFDFIAAQRGIEVCLEAGEVYVSTAFQEVSRVSLDDVLSGNKINWERITKAPEGQKNTGSLHILLSHRKESAKKPVLVVCREIWGSDPLPFQQVAMGDLS